MDNENHTAEGVASEEEKTTTDEKTGMECPFCGATLEEYKDEELTAEQRSALEWLMLTEASYLDPDALSKPQEYKDWCLVHNGPYPTNTPA